MTAESAPWPSWALLAEVRACLEIARSEVREPVRKPALTAARIYLARVAEELTTRTLRLVHQILERSIRQAHARDKVRRNVASLADVPEGRKDGHPRR